MVCVSPACDSCGEHVSPRYYQVRAGNDGELHACPSCSSPATRERDAAGVESAYVTRTDPNGHHIATAGGERE